METFDSLWQLLTAKGSFWQLFIATQSEQLTRTSQCLFVTDLGLSLPVFSHFPLIFFLLLCLILSYFFSRRCTQWTRCRRIKSSPALTNLQFILQGYFGSGCNALSLHPGLCQSHFPIIAPAYYLCNVSKIQTNTCNNKWSPPSLTIKRTLKWVTQSNRNIFCL